MNPLPHDDRRLEPRYAASGPVTLHLSTIPAAPIAGTLVDASVSGFRCRHRCLAMASGQEVQFEYGGREGRARVVWVRIADGQAEAGFQILPPHNCRG